MTPQEHKTEAERLLAEGVKVVRMISELADGRNAYGSDQLEYRDLTRQMDEFGKKAMGTWAQAQVHATLSTGKLFVSGGEYR